MSTGKDLEALIKESCELQDIDCTRLKDAGWQGEDTKRRFTSKNLCDFIIFDGIRLVYAEVKSSKDRLDLKRLTQHADLIKKQSQWRKNVHCGYIVQIKDVYAWIPVFDVEEFIKRGEKKSINCDDALRIGYEIMTFTPNRARKPRLDISFMMGVVMSNA